MDTTRIALLIGSIGAGLLLVLLLVPNALFSMLRPVPEAPTPAPTEVVEAPTEAPTSTPVPLPTPAPVPTVIPTTEPATVEPEQAGGSDLVAPDMAIYEQAILDSFNCARAEAGVEPYTLNEELTVTAYAAGEQLDADSNLELSDVAPDALLRSNIALEPDAAQSGCAYYGYDATRLLPELTEINEIGIAVFPSSVEYLGPSAIVLGR